MIPPNRSVRPGRASARRLAVARRLPSDPNCRARSAAPGRRRRARGRRPASGHGASSCCRSRAHRPASPCGGASPRWGDRGGKAPPRTRQMNPCGHRGERWREGRSGRSGRGSSMSGDASAHSSRDVGDGRGDVSADPVPLRTQRGFCHVRSSHCRIRPLGPDRHRWSGAWCSGRSRRALRQPEPPAGRGSDLALPPGGPVGVRRLMAAVAPADRGARSAAHAAERAPVGR